MEVNWIDKKEYPFQNRYIHTPNGKMHYIDEGQGEVLLFVHGTPTWSFLWRNFIKKLSKNYRCIAMDHIGFGLSEKNKAFEGTPEAHSENLKLLITKLGLEKFTLIVHDFGGPIGLSCALTFPDKVQNLVLFNTWLWETKNDKSAQQVSKILHNPIGNFIYLNTNFSARILFKQAFFNKKALAKNIHRHYTLPFPNKHTRHGLLKIGKALLGSSDWYELQKSKISTLKDIPVQIIWGTKDPLIKLENLQKWTNLFPAAQVAELESGHFIQEEKWQESVNIIEEFLKN